MEQGPLQGDTVGVPEKHKSWRMQVEGSMGRVATDGGSLRGRVGKWLACGCVVQLDHDEEMRRSHGMYGSMELEVQRTIKRAELTAFLNRHKRVIGPWLDEWIDQKKF